MASENIAHEIHVACALIVRNGKVLLTQRSETMKLPLKWEFPGGKIEDNETPEECIVREITEELSVKVSVAEKLMVYKHRYTSTAIVLHPFVCNYNGEEITLHEHRALAWVSPDTLLTYDLAAADIPAAQEFIKLSSLKRYV